MEQQDRRRSERKTLGRLTYMDITGGNGGVVTDVSEGGLGFRAVAPIEKTATVRFVLSGHSNAVEGAGNVVWTDDSRRTGGLSFTEFPAEIREQIRHWPLLTQLPLEPFAGRTVNKAPALHYGVPYAPGAAPESTTGNYYKQYFPDGGSSESVVAVGTRGRLLRIIGISGLALAAGMLGYVSYRQAQRRPANPNPGAPQQQVFGIESRSDSGGSITPGESSNSSDGIAPLQGSGGRPGAGGEALPNVPAPVNAKSAGPPSNARLAPQNAPVLHESEADQPLILVVQVAAVAQEPDAYQILNALQKKHFSAFISPPVNDALYRVQLGPYQTPEAARASVAALEKAGYKPFIVISR